MVEGKLRLGSQIQNSAALRNFLASMLGTVNNIIHLSSAGSAGGILGVTEKMYGLGSTFIFTPARTGQILVILSGIMQDDNSNGAATSTGGEIQLKYGTGAAPANQDAATGTNAGGVLDNEVDGTAITAVYTPFCRTAIITGLTIGTQIWLDLSGLGGDATTTVDVTNLELTVIEF